MIEDWQEQAKRVAAALGISHYSMGHRCLSGKREDGRRCFVYFQGDECHIEVVSPTSWGMIDASEGMDKVWFTYYDWGQSLDAEARIMYSALFCLGWLDSGRPLVVYGGAEPTLTQHERLEALLAFRERCERLGIDGGVEA